MATRFYSFLIAFLAIFTIASGALGNEFYRKVAEMVNDERQKVGLVRLTYNKLACLGNPDPVGMKVYRPTGKETFDDEKKEEAPPRRDRGEAT